MRGERLLTSTLSLAYSGDIFQMVREIPFPQVYQKFSQSEMRRQGRFFIALCPFHQEKTPSFTIYGNGFKCFGCGEAGDSVSFVGKLYDVRPVKAARLIASAFGLSVAPSSIPSSKQRELREVERERRLQASFREWERAAFLRLVGFRDAVKGVFVRDGLNSDPAILGVMNHIPEIEYYIDILATGGEAEKVALLKWGVI